MHLHLYHFSTLSSSMQSTVVYGNLIAAFLAIDSQRRDADEVEGLGELDGGGYEEQDYCDGD